MTAEIRSLTGLRGLAALTVVLYHIVQRDEYLGQFTANFLRHGYLAVDLFFVLSGFVIAMNYARHFEAGITHTLYARFLAQRFARIYPLYLALTLVGIAKFCILVLLLGIAPAYLDLSDMIASLFLVQNWGFGFTGVIGPSWSVSVEVIAYLVFPFIVLFFRWSALRAAWLLAVCVAAEVVVATSHLGLAGPLDVVESHSILPLVRCLAGFATGVITYWCSQQSRVRALGGHSLFALGTLAVLVALIAFNVHDLLVVGVFPALLVCSACEPKVITRVFANRFSHHLGLLSFAIYLVHPLIIQPFDRIEHRLETNVGVAAHLLTIVLALVAVWVSAYVLFWCVEKPGRKFVLSRLAMTSDRRAEAAANSPR